MRALLRTVCSEVCGTDVHLWHGRLAGVPYPIIPGHVSAGVLDRVRGDLQGSTVPSCGKATGSSSSMCTASMQITKALVDPWQDSSAAIA